MWLCSIFLLLSVVYLTSAKVAIIKAVIDCAFAGASNILYFRSEDTRMDHNVNSALMRLEDKTFVVVNANSPVQDFKSTAHVLIFKNALLNQLNVMEYIPEHNLRESVRSIVFIQKGMRNFAMGQLEEAYPVGTEVVLVQETLSSVCIHVLWNGNSFCVNSTRGIKSLLVEKFGGRARRPMPKGVFTVQTFDCPPYVHNDKRKKHYSGIEYNILKEVTRNWAVVVNVARDNDVQRSKWSFALDVLLEGKADMAMCSMWFNSLVTLVPNVTFTYPFMSTCVTLLVPKPQLLPDISYVFQPVQLNLWISCIVLIPLMSFVIQVFSKNSDFASPTFNSIRILTLGSLTTPPAPDQQALRFILASFSVTSLLLSTAYAAGFISLLTYPRLVKPISYAEDVVQMEVKIDAEVPDVAQLADFFRKFENRNMQRMAELMVSSMLEEYRGLDTKDFARIVKLIGGKYVSDTDAFDNYKRTHLRLLKECLFEAYNSFVLRKESRYVAFFNKVLVQLHEHGFLVHWYRESTVDPSYSYMSNFFSSYVSENFGHDSLTVSKLNGAFVMLGIGLGLSLIVFFCEILKKY